MIGFFKADLFLAKCLIVEIKPYNAFEAACALCAFCATLWPHGAVLDSPGFTPTSAPDVPIPIHHPFVAGQFIDAHRAARMQFVGADADTAPMP
jgi:hypothetical protein